MKLKRLVQFISDFEVRGSKEVEITGICSDSRRVGPGNLFVARRGTMTDGTLFIPDALAAGAVAVATDLYDPTLKVTQLISPTLSKLEADLAAAFYGHPSRALFTVGITGTNGKTTTAYLIQHLFDTLELPCGLLGTIAYVTGAHSFSATRTTPDVCSLHKMLREMVRSGCKAAALEVTSHALDQGRVAHVDFDVGVFTNLSHDHLDYHGTMQQYAAAKKRLIAQCKRIVINADGPFFETFLHGDVLTFGKRNADLTASDIILSPEMTRFRAHYGGDSEEIVLPLAGHFNVSNALAALGAGLFAGKGLHEMAAVLATMPPIAGRLERVPTDADFQTFVDYAHTPDALRQALRALRELKPRRLIVVFGCGGERDLAKRPEMGRVAAELADTVIITSDNPRNEDPEAICREIAEPLSHYHMIVDRREAICEALSMAQAGDIILIAGKGHETHQIGPWGVLPFSDRAVVQECLV